MKSSQSLINREVGNRLMPRLRILVAGAFGILIFYRAWLLADPPAPLRTSRATTLITEPLAADGLPDYTASRLASLKRVTGSLSQENGAVLFWKAIGSAEIIPQHRKLLFDELGCSVPSEQGVLEGIRSDAMTDRLSIWLAAEHDAKATETFADPVRQFSSLLGRRHWPKAKTPPLTDWFDENRPAIDMLVRATRKPRFYSPSPSWLEPSPPALWDMLVPFLGTCRNTSSSLAAFATGQVSRAELNACLETIQTLLQYSEIAASKDSVLSSTIAVEFRREAYRVLHIYADTAREERDLKQASKLLQTFGELDVVPRGLNGDAILMTDAIVRFADSRRSAPHIGNDYEPIRVVANDFDSNIVLGHTQVWLERMLALIPMKDRMVRRHAAREIWTDLEQLAIRRASKQEILINCFSRRRRSEAVSLYHLIMLLPALEAFCAAEDTAVALHRLTQVAIEVQAHQVATGQAPESLDRLRLKHLRSLPKDPFTNQPFRYERRGDGFVIYSLGPNGIDDGASDRTGELVDGEYAPIDWFGERDKPDGPDDIVVRLPVPELEVPRFQR